MKRIIAAVAVVGLLAACAPGFSRADVKVNRTGTENPVVEVSRSVIYGGLAGLVLGTALAIASEGGNDGDIIRWSFFAGTVAGLAAGIYFVSHRPQPAALLEMRRDAVEVHAPELALSPEGGGRIAIVAYRF